MLAAVATMAASSLSNESTAAVIYDIEVFDAGGTSVGAGSLDFAGSLAADGTFPLAAADLSGFSLTFDTFGAPITITLADLNAPNLLFDYAVSGGELLFIDLNASPILSTGACTECLFEFGVNAFAGSTSGGAFLVDLRDGDPFLTGASYTLSRAPLPAPEPGTLILFTVGLGGLLVLHRRRRWLSGVARAAA